MQRHRPDQRPEPKVPGALCNGAQEYARRRRHAERRRVMLGEMVGVESRAIVGFRNLEAILVIIRERAAVTVEMIENPEFHFLSALRSLRCVRAKPVIHLDHLRGRGNDNDRPHCALSLSFSRPTASTSCVQRATSSRMNSATWAGA